MFRLRELFAICLLIAVAHSRSADDFDDVAIRNVEAKLKQLNELVERVDTRIGNLITDITDITTPAIEKFGQTMIDNTYAFEENIKKYLNVDLTKDTCGILSLREYAQNIYSTAKLCTDKIVRDLLSDINAATGSTTELTREFDEVHERVRNCRDLEDEENKKMCLEEVQIRTNELLEKFNEVAIKISSQNYLMKVPQLLKTCLTADGGRLLVEKIEEILSCLKENVPGFKEFTEQVRHIADLFRRNVLGTIDSIGKALIHEFKKLQETLIDITSDLKIAINAIKNDLITFLLHIKSDLERLAQRLLYRFCTYCSCRLCTFCPCDM